VIADAPLPPSTDLELDPSVAALVLAFELHSANVIAELRDIRDELRKVNALADTLTTRTPFAAFFRKH
jgi:hypothetical protein